MVDNVATYSAIGAFELCKLYMSIYPDLTGTLDPNSVAFDD